jgi:hypothetical protein
MSNLKNFHAYFKRSQKSGILKKHRKKIGDFMSKCRMCDKPSEISQRTGKAKLYCSKKCANKWHHQRGPKRYVKKNADWGTRGQRDEFEKEKKALEREAKNAWIDENCIAKADLAIQLGICEGTLWRRCKELGVKTHKKIIPAEKSHKTFTFIEKKDVEAIENYKGKSYKAVAPLGFMSKADAAAYLGVTEITIITKLRRIKEKVGEYPVRREYAAEVKEGTPAMRCFYNEEDIKRVKEMSFKQEFQCNFCKVEFQATKERKYCSTLCKSKDKTRKKELKAKGLVKYKEAQERIGCSNSWSGLSESVVKIGSSRYIEEAKIQSLKWKYKDFLERETKDRVIRRKDNWQDWKVREERLIKSFPAKLKRLEEKWGVNSKEVDNLLNAIDVNYSYHGIMEVTGKITSIVCKNCDTEKPFYEFHFSARGSKVCRKTSHCRECVSKDLKLRRDAKTSKEKRNKNYTLRVRTSVATSIKRHIAKVTGVYCPFSVPKIWQAIENKCGYGHKALVDHLEAQFTPNMNWYNQKTPREPGEFGWHMDHIQPHSDYKYDFLDHPDFIACWALENLRPLEAVMNMQKGNKKLYQSFQSSFRDGIKRAVIGEEYTYGVWKHLDYTNLEAKKILEKIFSAENGMSWENWGEVWQLDHIEPVARLAFTSPRERNFKKCWNLANLQPLTRKNNSSKGSRWENQLWFHNF